jgi:hypothetical protein
VKRTVHILLLLVLLPSCLSARKRISTKKLVLDSKEIVLKSQANQQLSDDIVRLQEAKMGDIPLPLSATPLPDYFDPSSHSTVLGYSDKQLSPDQLKQFFMQELERSGWLLKEQFSTSHEMLIRFKKPHRICIISIRQHDPKMGSCIVIFTGLSDEVTNQALD